ncbi:hypothetical protein [Xanthomonas axonopodis]
MNAYISDIQVCMAAQMSFGLCTAAEFLYEMTGYTQEDFDFAFQRAARKGLVNIYNNDTVLISGAGSIFLQGKSVQDYMWLAGSRVQEKLAKKEARRRWDVQQLIKSKLSFARTVQASV